MARIFLNLGILFLTIVIGVALFETTVRFLMPQYDPSGHLKFKVNKDGVTLAANRGNLRQIKNTGDYDVKVGITNLGLRELKPLNEAKSSDIFVVGDSFSFGWGVEESDRFSNQLEKLLSPSKTFNISIPTNITGYAKLLKYATDNGAHIKRLIVGITMENDLKNYDPLPIATKSTRLNQKSQSFNIFPPLLSVKTFLRDHSAAYFLTTSIVQNNSTLKKLMINMGYIIPNGAGIPLTSYSEKTINSSVQRLNCLIKRYDTIVLIIPSRGLWVGTTKQRATAQKIHDHFTNALKARKIPIVDMQAPMERFKKPMDYHFKNDGHWRSAAHKLAAQELAQKIKIIWN
jgi:hypothetical protein